MADLQDSHTQGLSRSIDKAYADFKPGDVEGERRLYEAFLAQAKNVVAYKLRRWDTHLARDIATRALLNLSTFAQKSRLSTWFYRIAQNEAAGRLKNDNKDRKHSLAIDGTNHDGSASGELRSPENRAQVGGRELTMRRLTSRNFSGAYLAGRPR